MQPLQLGPFKIKRTIGRGGMGAVYEAEHVESGEIAAVKALLGVLEDDVEMRLRFEAEIDTLKRLRHPNIVRLYGFGEEAGMLYYVMEYVDGPSLHAELRRKRHFEWYEVAKIGLDMCSALKHAHDRGITHRDIKPANILLERDGETKLSDYGIAQLFGGERLTHANAVVGTLEYMAPEQALANPVGPRADLYSLGAVLYALLVGRPPFSAKSLAELLRRHGTAHIEPVRVHRLDVPEAFDSIVCDLLKLKQEERPGNAYLAGRRIQSLLQATVGPPESIRIAVQEIKPQEPVPRPISTPFAGGLEPHAARGMIIENGMIDLGGIAHLPEEFPEGKEGADSPSLQAGVLPLDFDASQSAIQSSSPTAGHGGADLHSSRPEIESVPDALPTAIDLRESGIVPGTDAHIGPGGPDRERHDLAESDEAAGESSTRTALRESEQDPGTQAGPNAGARVATDGTADSETPDSSFSSGAEDGAGLKELERKPAGPFSSPFDHPLNKPDIQYGEILIERPDLRQTEDEPVPETHTFTFSSEEQDDAVPEVALATNILLGASAASLPRTPANVGDAGDAGDVPSQAADQRIASDGIASLTSNVSSNALSNAPSGTSAEDAADETTEGAAEGAAGIPPDATPDGDQTVSMTAIPPAVPPASSTPSKPSKPSAFPPLPAAHSTSSLTTPAGLRPTVAEVANVSGIAPSRSGRDETQADPLHFGTGNGLKPPSVKESAARSLSDVTHPLGSPPPAPAANPTIVESSHVPKKPHSRFVVVDDQELDDFETEASPRHPWVSLQTWIIAFALLAVGVGTFYLLQPAAPEVIYERIERETDNPDRITALRRAEPNIRDFIKWYSDHPYAPAVRELENELRLANEERALERGVFSRDQVSTFPPAKRAYMDAIALSRTEPEKAIVKLRAIIDLYQSDKRLLLRDSEPGEPGGSATSTVASQDEGTRPSGSSENYVQLARRRLEQLEQDLAQIDTKQVELLDRRLDDAEALQTIAPERSRAIRQAIINLYGDCDWATEVVERAHDALNAQAAAP